MSVAVDEARDCAEPASVELLDVVLECRQVSHAAGRLDATRTAQHVRILHHVDVGEGAPAQG